MKIRIAVPNFTKAKDAFGNDEYYIELDGIRLIIRNGWFVGWYKP